MTDRETPEGASDDLPEFEFSDELMKEIDEQQKAQEADQAARQAAQQEAAAVAAQQAAIAAQAAAAAAKQAASGESASEGTGQTEFFAWQIAHADMDRGALEDADNYPDYIVNRATVMQMLGVGMASGQNAFPLNGQMFVAAISRQDENGQICLIGPDHPRYADLAAKVSESLIAGEDHGMLAILPNGVIVAITPPADAASL